MGPQEVRLFTGIVIGSILFVLVMLGFLIWILYRHKRHIELQRQYREAEITTLEKERARMANDLHDHLSPKLAAVKMVINQFELVRNDDVLLQEKTNETIDQLSQDLREISFDLMPSSLQSDGLLKGVEQLINYINHGNDIAIRLMMPPSIDLPQEYAVHVYRIIQEIVHNTVKHARASELFIKIFEEDGKLIVTTKDNGVGFHLGDKQKGRRGLGLKSMRGRAELMNGDLEIETLPGKGTCFTLIVPL